MGRSAINKQQNQGRTKGGEKREGKAISKRSVRSLHCSETSIHMHVILITLSRPSKILKLQVMLLFLTVSKIDKKKQKKTGNILGFGQG
jgi:hypothetical protein